MLAVKHVDNLVMVSGLSAVFMPFPPGQVPEGVELQTDAVLRKAGQILSEAGSDLSKVISIRIYLREFTRDFPRMERIYRKYFPGDQGPLRTCVGVTHLVRDAQVEIEMIATKA